MINGMAIKVLKKVTKEEFKDFLYDIDISDEKLYGEMNKQPIGIFQFSANTAEVVTRQIKPQNFNDMVAINSFARPGTSGFLPQYLENRERGTSKYPKVVNDILEETWFVCLYQEECMSIFNKIGGFSLAETNTIRGLMKKLSKAEKKQEDLDAWDEAIERFEKGAVENGLTISQAKSLANDMLSMSSYAFNKCVDGGCYIDRDNTARWKPTIREMYLTKNDKAWAKENGHESLYDKYNREGYGKAFSLHEDGRLYPNDIVDIYYQGEKEVFEITLENGKKIKVTSNHNFPIYCENGSIIYKCIDSGLSVGDCLISNDGYRRTQYNYNFSDYTKETRIFREYNGSGFKENKGNSGYINGEYVKFEENRKIINERTNGVCELCGEETDRIEVHHVDFDRHHNDIENLIGLCPSCHKKEHYKAGRNKKNERGKITSQVKIVSIVSAGITDVYDIEMANPYHTLSVNGIVAKNSHAVCYSYVALMSLYLTNYFRKYFYSSIIEYTFDKKRDDVPKVLKEIRSKGYKILPPDINVSKPKTFASGNDIYIGLHNLKQVGDAALPIYENSPYESFIDFITKNSFETKVNKRSITSLVNFGCFDKIEPELNRKQMVYSFTEFWDKRKNITKSKLSVELQGSDGTITVNQDNFKNYVQYLSELKNSKEFSSYVDLWNNIKEVNSKNSYMIVSTQYLKELEKEVLGFNFFVSSFDENVRNLILEKEGSGVMLSSLDDLKKTPEVSRVVPVYISSVRDLRDRNGNDMAFVTIEDLYGNSVVIPVFASFYKFIGDRIIDGTIVFMLLYYHRDGSRGDSIMLGMNKYISDENKINRFVIPARRMN